MFPLTTDMETLRTGWETVRDDALLECCGASGVSGAHMQIG